MIDESTFYNFIEKAFKLTFEERNNLYFQIKDQIDKLGSDEAARNILTIFVELLKNRGESVEVKAIEKTEGKIAGGLFRRVPS
jgi:hypothetical protein